MLRGVSRKATEFHWKDEITKRENKKSRFTPKRAQHTDTMLRPGQLTAAPRLPTVKAKLSGSDPSLKQEGALKETLLDTPWGTGWAGSPAKRNTAFLG